MSKKNRHRIYFFSSLYFIILTSILIYHQVFLTIDLFILSSFILLIFLNNRLLFLIDWIPFGILLISYEYLRSLVPFFLYKVHVMEMVQADKFMFSLIPTIALQKMFYSAANISWYDYVAVFLYFSHYTVPLIIAFIFWLQVRDRFTLFTLALLLLSYLGFITYLIYPAMPPWMAGKYHYIPHVDKIMYVVLDALGPKWNLKLLYKSFNPNEVAAVPSLHSAYPWLIYLFLTKIYKKGAFLFLPYLLAVFLSLVYLGEHYVIDIIIGVLYATGSFLIVEVINNKFKLCKIVEDVRKEIPATKI